MIYGTILFLSINSKSILEQVFFVLSLFGCFLGDEPTVSVICAEFLVGLFLMQSHLLPFSTMLRLGVVPGVGVLGVGLIMAVEQFMIALVGASSGWWLYALPWMGCICFRTIDSDTTLSTEHTMPWYFTSFGAFLGAILFSKF